MLKRLMTSIALLGFTLAVAASAQVIPGAINVRYSEQLSNAPAGNCGCFHLEGFATDADWGLLGSSTSHRTSLSLAADVGVEHAGAVPKSPYGLTLTTLAAGPRLWFPVRRTHLFGQMLFGFAHGFNSEFPQGNTLVPSASSFALDLGGGADYVLTHSISVRMVQVDYLRTSLPNISTNWQNNLRLGAGITFHFPRPRHH